MPSLLSYNKSTGNKPFLMMLVGQPASGKTTFINDLGNLVVTRDTMVISSDYYIELEAKRLNSTYDQVFKDYIKTATDRSKQDFAEAIKNQSNIIWDQTNLTVKSRAWKLAALPSDYVKMCTILTVSPEVQAERLASREGKQIPSNIINSMTDTFVWPSYDEGFDHILYRSGG